MFSFSRRKNKNQVQRNEQLTMSNFCYSLSGFCGGNPFVEYLINLISVDILNVLEISVFDEKIKKILTESPNFSQTPKEFITKFIKNMVLSGSLKYNCLYSNDRRLIGITLDNCQGALTFKYGESVLLPDLLYSAKTVKNKGIAAALSGLIGFLGHEGGLLADNQRAKIQADFNSLMSKADNFAVPVLERGMRFEKVDLSANVKNLNETQKDIVKDICYALGVPPEFVGLDGKLTKEQAALIYVKTIEKWLFVFEKFIFVAFRKNATLHKNALRLLVQFNADNFLKNGAITRNEYRALFGLGKVEGGDVLTIQAAQIPLQDVGSNFNR